MHNQLWRLSMVSLLSGVFGGLSIIPDAVLATGTSSLNGTVFYDVNGNGMQDTADPGIASQTVLLALPGATSETTRVVSEYLGEYMEDGDVFETSLTVDAPGSVVAVRAMFSVRDYDFDRMEFYLRSPSGKICTLCYKKGYYYVNAELTVDDNASQIFKTYSNPSTGIYKPDESLGVFQKEPAAGEWTMIVVCGGYNYYDFLFREWWIEIEHQGEDCVTTGIDGSYTFSTTNTGECVISLLNDELELTVPPGGVYTQTVDSSVISNLNFGGYVTGMDFGDAPDCYPVRYAENGARHQIGGPCLGSISPDSEIDGANSAQADADDLDGTDDEDGVVISSGCAGSVGTIDVTVDQQAGWVHGWIDFDNDGSWSDDEEVLHQFQYAGSVQYNYLIPDGAVPGLRAARFRICSTELNSPMGTAADGEVEDSILEVLPSVKVQGSVFYDKNNNGVNESGEPGIRGRLVFADLDDDGVRDTGWIYENDGYDTTFKQYWDLSRSTYVNLGGVPVTGVRVTLFTSGSPVSQMTVGLRSPSGNLVKLMEPTNGVSSTFLDGTVFTDKASIPMSGGSPPYSGEYLPVEPLSEFIGETQSGSWTLEIVTSSEEYGYFHGWTLELETLDRQSEPAYTTGPDGTYQLSIAYTGAVSVILSNPPEGWSQTLPAGEAPFYDLSVTSGAQVAGIDFSFNADLDFGDASPDYPVLFEDNGACHVMAGPCMGDKRDAEPDGLPHLSALGDDQNGDDDEDGLLIGTFARGATHYLSISVNDGPACLRGWFDVDGDGAWDDNEECLVNADVVTGRNFVPVTIPRDAVMGETFARFRIASNDVGSVSGLASNGEVEDYRIYIQESATIEGNVYLDADENGDRGSSDPSLSGVRVFIDTNTNGVPDGVTDFPYVGMLPLLSVPKGEVELPLTVSGVSGRVARVTVKVDIEHPFLIQTALWLRSPSGNWVSLVGNPQSGMGADYTQTVFDDTAAFSIDDGSPPFTGRFRPQEPLSEFVGEDPNGVWTLGVEEWQGTAPLINSVVLTVIDDSAMPPEMVVTSGKGGFYTLEDVPAGDVRVMADLPDGWVQVEPSGAAGYGMTVEPGVNYTGRDFGIVNDFDLGDLPQDRNHRFPVTFRAEGAAHGVSSLRLGELVDGETDGNPSADAQGDDNTGVDDEDGVKVVPLYTGFTTELEVVASGGEGILTGWMDFDRNGIWGSGEMICVQTLQPGTNMVPVDVPSDAVPGQAATRFRFSTRQSESFSGIAMDGEVEDYLFEILTPPSLQGSIFFDVDGDGVRDPEDSGIGGACAFVDLNDNGVYDYAHTWTPSDGIPFSGYFKRFTIPVSGLSGTVSRVELRVKIPGSTSVNAEIDLESPDNTTCEVIYRPGNWGDGAFPDVTLSDDAEVYMNVDNAPYNGRYRPFEPLSIFEGVDPNGVWDLVCDFSSSDYTVELVELKIWTSVAPVDEPGQLSNADGSFSITVLPDIVNRLSTAEDINYLGMTLPMSGFYDVIVPFGEDHVDGLDFGFNAPVDFGDAIESGGSLLPVTLSQGGAMHVAAGPVLGLLRDSEIDGQTSVDFLGDDLDGIDDEDGVLLPAEFVAGVETNIQVVVSGTNAWLRLWCDLDDDGEWQHPSELIVSEELAPGTNTIALTLPMYCAGRSIAARFRLSSRDSLAPGGIAPDGEVEDYLMHVAQPQIVSYASSSAPYDNVNGIFIPSYQISYEDISTGDINHYSVSLMADDFYAPERSVTYIRWWGCYQGYLSSEPGPVYPPDVTPDEFAVTVYANNPPEETRNYPMPGSVIRSMEESVAGLHEMYAGSVQTANGWIHVFSYEVELGSPLYLTAGNRYWLSIAARNLHSTLPETGFLPWAWLSTVPDEGIGYTVEEYLPSQTPEWVPLKRAINETGVYSGYPVDMAFSVKTTDPPGTDTTTNVVFTAVRQLPDGIIEMDSLGAPDNAPQTLMWSTNLTADIWLPVSERSAPSAAPDLNRWRAISIGKQRMYFKIIREGEE